jgi:NAD(P)H-flavin reductase
MEAQKPQQFTGVITQKIQLTKTVYHFVIQNQEPVTLEFQPGQYATFIINPQTRRQYSFCSAPDPMTFELVVDVKPMGPGSKYFLGKKEGERVEYLASLGNFSLSENSLKKIFVATGTGIAPFRSMLLGEIERLRDRETKRKGDKEISKSPDLQIFTPISLYWGLRYEDDVYWDAEFRALAGQYTGFEYFISLSKPGEDWHGLAGHITDHVLKNEKNPQNCEFYLCGNNAMIKEMKSRLSAINVERERIKIDLFY